MKTSSIITMASVIGTTTGATIGATRSMAAAAIAKASIKNSIIVAAVLALSACGGGSSGGSSGTEQSASGTQGTTSDQAPDSQVSTPQQPSSPEESEPEEQEPAENMPEETVVAGPSNPAACELSAIDQAMLNSVNAARAQARTCGVTSMAAVPALEWNCQLASIAQAHSDDMATNNFHSHTGSNGLSMVNRVDNIGYEYSRIGENIAAGQATVDSVMSAWLNSNDGHCENIMSANYTELGAGRRINDSSQFRIYWTQNFGRPR